MEHINPQGLLTWPQMSQVVVASGKRVAFIAGQTAADRDFNTVGGSDLGKQTLAAFKNMACALDAAGAKPEDVVSSTVYIVNLDSEKAGAFAAAMDTALDGERFPPHALTMVGVTSLGGADALIEISAVAVLPD